MEEEGFLPNGNLTTMHFEKKATFRETTALALCDSPIVHFNETKRGEGSGKKKLKYVNICHNVMQQHPASATFAKYMKGGRPLCHMHVLSLMFTGPLSH